MKKNYQEGIQDTLLAKGIQVRWFNDACYEIKLPNGKTILLDPYINKSPYKLLGTGDVTGADYMILSHTHFDHVMDVKELSQKFNSKIFVGKASAIELACYYDIPGYRIYPCAAGDVFEMGDFTLEVIFGKHTNMGGMDCPGNMANNLKHFGLEPEMASVMTCGSYEYCNFLITLPDNTQILIWGGEASVEAVNRAGHYHPDISIVQIPREPAEQIAQLYLAVGGKVIFPHHHETILDLEGGKERIEEMLAIVEQSNPYLNVICPKKGKWYSIQLAVTEENSVLETTK